MPENEKHIKARDWLNNLSDDDFYALLFETNSLLTVRVLNDVLYEYFRLRFLIKNKNYMKENRPILKETLKQFLIQVLNRDVLIRAATLTNLLEYIRFLPRRHYPEHLVVPIGFLDFYFHNLLTRNGLLAADLRALNIAHRPVNIGQCKHEKLRKWQVKFENRGYEEEEDDDV